VLADRQTLERFGLHDRVICRYDEHEYDIADNQLLTVALRRGSTLATLPRVRRRARRLASLLEDYCDPNALDLDAGEGAFDYSRHNEHYRAAHTLSWLLLDRRSINDDFSTGATAVRSFVIDMNALFERFVERLLREALTDEAVDITAQQRDSIFWRPDLARPYAAIRPDIVVQRRSTPPSRVPLDAKYKRYDSRAVAVEDLTQAFLYAYAYRERDSSTPPRALLAYPSETSGPPKTFNVQVRSVAERAIDAELTAIAIHIPTALHEIIGREHGPTMSALRRITTSTA
jgi:5-methylcytosine-specific restriction enzyme subunit McrC